MLLSSVCCCRCTIGVWQTLAAWGLPPPYDRLAQSVALIDNYHAEQQQAPFVQPLPIIDPNLANLPSIDTNLPS